MEWLWLVEWLLLGLMEFCKCNEALDELVGDLLNGNMLRLKMLVKDGLLVLLLLGLLMLLRLLLTGEGLLIESSVL